MQDSVEEGRITALRECRHGRMIYLRKDQYIGRSLDLYGEFSALEGDIFAQCLQPGQSAIEVGSNIGAHTLQLAKLVGPQGTVYAFEPQRQLFQLLCANLALNELFNVRAYHGALGRDTGTVRVPALDYSAELNFGGLSLGSASSGEQVPLWKIDAVSVREFHLLKVDVEGMEVDVIEGSRATIAKYRPVLYVENDRKQNSEALIRLIEELGYDMWWHLPPLFNPANFSGNPNNVFGGTVSVNLLCIPKERGAKVPHLRQVAGPHDWWKKEPVKPAASVGAGATPDEIFLRAAQLKQSGRLEESLAALDQVIALKPDYAEAFNNRGNVLQDLGRLDDAVASYRRAIALKPDYPFAFNNLAGAFRLLKQVEPAIAAYDKALALRPDYPAAMSNRGQCKLLLGRMAEGWPDYESRLQLQGFHENPIPDFPEWRGESLSGRTILVYAEQGLGDVIQFSRYLPHLAEQAAEITLLAPANLIGLLRGLRGNVHLTTSLVPGERFDCRCALMSLPYRFGTDLATIPSAVPYLSADPDRVHRWRRKTGEEGFRIGLCWQGKPGTGMGRSFPLQQAQPLSDIPGVRLISLQKDNGTEQLERLPRDMRVETLGAEFDNGPDAFLDAAAVIDGLDLVISCDTAIAHLAGALARPTWVAMKYVPDWRWLLDRADSPWYPTMRLFRQRKPDDWDGVFADMAEVLKSDLTSRSAARRS